MSRASHKETILKHGLSVMHQRGYSNSSVRDITAAANVPNGSFTNHFSSKEEFGLAVLDVYVDSGMELMERTILNRALAPLERLIAFIDESIAGLGAVGVQNGCLIGNFASEMGQNSDAIRERIAGIFKQRCEAIANCVQEAIDSGILSADIDSDDLGAFIIGAMQGATLLAKSQNSMEPMEKLRRTLVGTVLR